MPGVIWADMVGSDKDDLSVCGWEQVVYFLSTISNSWEKIIHSFIHSFL